jgi:hypothetical protein
VGAPGAAVKLFLGPISDASTLRYVEQLLGDIALPHHNITQSGDWSERRSSSEQLRRHLEQPGRPARSHRPRALPALPGVRRWLHPPSDHQRRQHLLTDRLTGPKSRRLDADGLARGRGRQHQPVQPRQHAPALPRRRRRRPALQRRHRAGESQARPPPPPRRPRHRRCRPRPPAHHPLPLPPPQTQPAEGDHEEGGSPPRRVCRPPQALARRPPSPQGHVDPYRRLFGVGSKRASAAALVVKRRPTR